MNTELETIAPTRRIFVEESRNGCSGMSELDASVTKC